MQDNKDYLIQRAAQLDIGRGEALQKAQSILDKLYPQMARALSLNDGTLKIITPNASLASELRLGQIKLLAKFNKALKNSHKINNLHIQIREL